MKVYFRPDKFRGKLAEKGFTIASFAEKTGIKRQTIGKLCKEPGAIDSIKYQTINNMAEILCDSYTEAESIFFNCELA